MEYIQQPATKQSKVKMKVIPWHCQQRYQSSLSQISLNHTLTAAQNARKMKTLLHNNKCLAKALVDCKYELTKKENEENIDIISIAGLKLKDLSDNLKKINFRVDELVSLLQSHKPTKDAKNFLYALASRRDFRQRMQSLSGLGKVEEIVESLENQTDSMSKQHFKNNNESKKNLAKNIKGKNTPQASFKQKSIKRRSNQVIEKLPQNVSQRDSRLQDDSQPSYLLDLSFPLDSFKNKIEESKTEVDSKCPEKNKPLKSKRDIEQCTLVQHSTNAIGKSNKKVIAKLPKNVSQRDSRPQNDSQPSYLLGLSSHLDSFQNKNEEGKGEVSYKVPANKKPPKSKGYIEQFTLKHSADVLGKNKQKTGSCKRVKPIQSSINKKNTKDNSKAGKFKSHIIAKITSTLQDDSTTSQPSDGITTSSDGKSCENFKNLTGHSTKTKVDEIASGLQCDNKTCNLNEATYKIHTDEIYSDLEAELLLRQPRVVLRKSILASNQVRPQTFTEQQSVPLNEIIDGCQLPSEKFASTETTPSIVSKKKVQFLVEEDNIEILSAALEPLKKITVKKTLKRPLKEYPQNLVSVSKKRALTTFGEALQKGEIMSKNTFIVTAEVHKPPDGFIPEKSQSLENINLLNMQPTVVLTDIFKSNLQNAVLGCTYHSQILQGESATTEVVQIDQNSLYSDDASTCHDLTAMNNKENKIDGQKILGERKQGRRVSSKVSSYKEMKLNVKMRRC